MIDISIVGDKITFLKDGKIIEKTNLKSNNIKFEIEEFIERIESQEINKLRIKDIYKYDNIELYNFARGSICNKISEILSKLSIIEYIANEFSREEIIINTNDEILKYIAINIFDLKCKSLNLSDNSYKKKKNIKLYYLKLKRIIYGIKNLLKYYFKNKKNGGILAISQASAINTIKIEERTINYEALYGNVLEKLSLNNNIVNLQYLNSEDYIEKSFKLNKEFIPFEIFLILKKSLFKLILNEKKIEDNLYILKDFNFNFHNINIYKVFNKFLLNDIKSIFNSYLSEIYAAEKFIEMMNIKKVICVDEADRPRCFIYSGNKLFLDTYGIQHGIITKASVSYMIPSSDKNYIPKKTFLWGENFRDILINNTKIYDISNTEVVGQVRTDYLIKKINFKEDKIEKNDECLNLLYATQYIDDLSSEATELLFKALNRFNKKYNLLIKLHPADKYESKYVNYLNEYNIKNAKIVKDMDIYEAILWSDIVISVHSTINLEALILNRPSICILLKKYWDNGNFVRSGVSFGAKNEEELVELFNSISFDNTKNIIENNFYKVDGNVSDRIVKFISCKKI